MNVTKWGLNVKTNKRAIFAIACAIGAASAANANTEPTPLIIPERGAKYHLTARSADLLQLDYRALLTGLNVKENEHLAFEIKEDGELDISVYKQGMFSQLRADITGSL